MHAFWSTALCDPDFRVANVFNRFAVIQALRGGRRGDRGNVEPAAYVPARPARAPRRIVEQSKQLI
jgi:hypothetical protein